MECVKTCADIERQNYSELRSDDLIARKILNKDPSLDRFKVKQLLNVNKIDLLCVANLNLIRKKKIEPITTISTQAKTCQSATKSAPKRSRLSSKVTSSLESTAICSSSNLQTQTNHLWINHCPILTFSSIRYHMRLNNNSHYKLYINHCHLHNQYPYQLCSNNPYPSHM